MSLSVIRGLLILKRKGFPDVMTNVAGSLPPTTTYEGYEVYDALHHTIHDVDFDFQHFSDG